MPCFCPKVLEPLEPSFLRMRFSFTPPTIPLQLRLAAAMPQLGDPERMDIRINAAIQNMRLPTISVMTPPSGPLIAIAAQLKIAGGVFTIDDLPKLEAELKQSAYTINRFLLPRLKLLMRFNPLPVIQLAAVARLKLAIDPIEFAAMTDPANTAPHRFSFATSFTPPALTPPKLKLALALSGIPTLLSVAESLNMSLADPGVPGAFLGRLNALASLQMPALDLPMGELLTLAAILDSLAVIKEAFGDDAMTPKGLSSIALSLNTFMRLPLPSPLPNLALAESLALLPPLDNVKIGATAAGAHPQSLAGFRFTPPKIAIMPFISLVLALRASLNGYLKIDPLDFCGGSCEAPLPMFA